MKKKIKKCLVIPTKHYIFAPMNLIKGRNIIPVSYATLKGWHLSQVIFVTNENIKQLCLDSLKVGDFEYENKREQIKEAFCYAIEKDLREKGVIDENETVEYYTVLTE